MPGTQPFEVAPYDSIETCRACHSNTVNPEYEPYQTWQGGMMAHSARDPLFWAQLAVSEQSFPGSGDFCLRCHTPQGWLQGRSVPTDGSALNEAIDANGIECQHCHLLVDPDPPVNVEGTVEEQNAPFVANDGVDAYRGSGMFVLNNNADRTRLGPYDDATAPHTFQQSALHRESELCATCHDVSNPIVGDLAHNNGAAIPLEPGSFSGVPGAPVTNKAAFNNHPQAYGVVERTYSEWKASALADLSVDDFSTLPADMQLTGGALEVAYSRSWNATTQTADYVDGTARAYTCQTCHMSASTGYGCAIGNTPQRTDLPRHDLTGASYWTPAAIQYQIAEGTLRFGSMLDGLQIEAMDAGMLRARDTLQSSARIDTEVHGDELVVKVTNLTGHKLTTGYPEGRRLWLNVRWYNGLGVLVHEDGEYGSIGRTVRDRAGVEHDVQSLLDPDGTVVIETKPAIDQEWASQLLGLGLAESMPLAYDRQTDEVTETLGSLALQPAGSAVPTFHFALNNTTVSDNRIPPYGMDRDMARAGNFLPEPATQYGNPSEGEAFAHWRSARFTIPASAGRAEVRLYYQQTSWEYVQFLWLQNDEQNPFLGEEGINLLDAWLNTALVDAPAPDDHLLGELQAPPLQMALADVQSLAGASSPGETALSVGWNPATGLVEAAYAPACDATDHTVYYGPLEAVGSYDYSGAFCNVGTTGAVTFDPGDRDVFFLIVGNNTLAEGSYGRNAAGAERPEDVDTLGCEIVQDLADTCLVATR